jgi:hypothetical protein
LQARPFARAPTRLSRGCPELTFGLAETTLDRRIDPNFPLGRAVNLAMGRSDYCSNSCGVPL